MKNMKYLMGVLLVVMVVSCQKVKLDVPNNLDTGAGINNLIVGKNKLVLSVAIYKDQVVDPPLAYYTTDKGAVTPLKQSFEQSKKYYFKLTTKLERVMVSSEFSRQDGPVGNKVSLESGKSSIIVERIFGMNDVSTTSMKFFAKSNGLANQIDLGEVRIQCMDASRDFTLTNNAITVSPTSTASGFPANTLNLYQFAVSNSLIQYNNTLNPPSTFVVNFDFNGDGIRDSSASDKNWPLAEQPVAASVYVRSKLDINGLEQQFMQVTAIVRNKECNIVKSKSYDVFLDAPKATEAQVKALEVPAALQDYNFIQGNVSINAGSADSDPTAGTAIQYFGSRKKALPEVFPALGVMSCSYVRTDGVAYSLPQTDPTKTWDWYGPGRRLVSDSGLFYTQQNYRNESTSIKHGITMTVDNLLDCSGLDPAQVAKCNDPAKSNKIFVTDASVSGLLYNTDRTPDMQDSKRQFLKDNCFLKMKVGTVTDVPSDLCPAAPSKRIQYIGSYVCNLGEIGYVDKKMSIIIGSTPNAAAPTEASLKSGMFSCEVEIPPPCVAGGGGTTSGQCTAEQICSDGSCVCEGSPEIRSCISAQDDPKCHCGYRPGPCKCCDPLNPSHCWNDPTQCK